MDYLVHIDLFLPSAIKAVGITRGGRSGGGGGSVRREGGRVDRRCRCQQMSLCRWRLIVLVLSIVVIIIIKQPLLRRAAAARSYLFSR